MLYSRYLEILKITNFSKTHNKITLHFTMKNTQYSKELYKIERRN